MNKNQGHQTNYANTVPFDTTGSYTPLYPQTASSVETSQAPRFGLIRGYHRQMYEPQQHTRTCCGWNNARPGTGPLICNGCNWGIFGGCVFLGIGVIAILTGFMLPQQAWTRRVLSRDEIKKLNRMGIFIDMFIIFGLSMLAIGGLIVSVSLLWPFIRPKRDYREDSVSAFMGSDVYVKAEEKPMNSSHTDSYLSLGFHREFEVGDVSLQRVQPRAERKGPIDLVVINGR